MDEDLGRPDWHDGCHLLARFPVDLGTGASGLARLLCRLVLASSCHADLLQDTIQSCGGGWGHHQSQHTRSGFPDLNFRLAH